MFLYVKYVYARVRRGRASAAFAPFLALALTYVFVCLIHKWCVYSTFVSACIYVYIILTAGRELTWVVYVAVVARRPPRRRPRRRWSHCIVLLILYGLYYHTVTGGGGGGRRPAAQHNRPPPPPPSIKHHHSGCCCCLVHCILFSYSVLSHKLASAGARSSQQHYTTH